MNAFAEEKHVGTLSGFIFLCNGKTKPECYIYRVFGLPDVRRDVVENIKPGMKLFLFDFELKLLYGVYEATSTGRLNMEPAAFGGKFPAQVGFRIFEDCFPLHESSFKHAIEENYQKGKFKQELNDQQVQSLLSLFRPLSLSTSVPSLPSLPVVARQLTLPPPRIDNLSHVRTTFSENDPSAAVVQVGPNLSISMPRHALQRVEGQNYAYDGLSANFHPSVRHQTLPASEMTYSENPYAARIPYVHAPKVLETNFNDQNALSSHVSYGSIGNTGYAHHATVQAPAGSYYHDDAPKVLETNFNDQNALSSQHVSYGSIGNTGYAHHATVQAPDGSYYHDDAPKVLETNFNDQNALSSQHVSYGRVGNTGYAHHATVQAPAGSYYHDDTRMMVNSAYLPHSIGQQQPLQVPASYYNSAATQQTYTAGNPHYRYGHEAEVSYGSQHPESANLHHLTLERNQNVVYPEQAVNSSGSWWPTQDGVQNNASHYPTTYNAV